MQADIVYLIVKLNKNVLVSEVTVTSIVYHMFMFVSQRRIQTLP
jgi:hypothetical protein